MISNIMHNFPFYLVRIKIFKRPLVVAANADFARIHENHKTERFSLHFYPTDECAVDASVQSEL